MATRILHVSDLHFGTENDAAVERALVELVAHASPQLVLCTGDLTHRGQRSQHDLAAAFLRRLGPPVVAVPGNHDIPYAFPARFTSPWTEFERQWETVEPVHAAPGVHVVGVNSVRPWRHQSGAVREAQLRRVEDRLQEAAPGALRVVALHHQLVGAPWRSRKKPVADRSRVLGRLVDAGAELIVGGHIHQGAVSERHEFEVLPEGAPSVVVSIAPGLGQPRPHRRGEARGVVLYEATGERLRVDTHIWRGGGWQLTATRAFARGQARLAQ